MFPIRLLVAFVTAFVLIHGAIGSDCLKEINENEKINLNLNLSAAVNFIIQNVSANSIRVFGCKKHFQNDLNELSKHWRTNVTLTLLNVEKKYTLPRKIHENDFVLILADVQFLRCLEKFMENIKGQIRRHKSVVIFKTEDCDRNG